MTFLIEYRTAIGAAATALMTIFLVVHIRYFMGIRDALFKNVLPFMWVLCAVVVAEDLLVSGPVNVYQGDTWGVIVCAFNALIYGYWSHKWFHIWRNSDDDTWKKRRRRIVEKIELVSGRLVPVPVN